MPGILIIFRLDVAPPAISPTISVFEARGITRTEKFEAFLSSVTFNVRKECKF